MVLDATAVAPDLPSASANPTAVSAYLENECSHSHLAGPYASCPFSNVRCSGVGIVPMKSGGSASSCTYQLGAELVSTMANLWTRFLCIRLRYDAIHLNNKYGPDALLSEVAPGELGYGVV